MEQQLEIPTIERPRIAFGRALVLRLARRAEHATGLPAGSIVGPGRGRAISYARFAVMKVAAELRLSRTSTATHLGGMNHSSVCYGIERATRLENNDEDFAELLRLLRAEALRG